MPISINHLSMCAPNVCLTDISINGMFLSRGTFDYLLFCVCVSSRGSDEGCNVQSWVVTALGWQTIHTHTISVSRLVIPLNTVHDVVKEECIKIQSYFTYL